MSLHKTDFNLLKAFDALMQTRHVTRAAQLAGIGQPGMSAALSRLRETFQDDLLVRQGGEMVPTPRALALEPDIRRVLREIGRLVEEPDNFDPRASTRCVPIRLSDLLSRLLLPGLLDPDKLRVLLGPVLLVLLVAVLLQGSNPGNRGGKTDFSLWTLVKDHRVTSLALPWFLNMLANAIPGTILVLFMREVLQAESAVPVALMAYFLSV